jgi:mRNA-degrading endonuclease RelE of RelBE toxin-antitoxin system
MYKVFKKLSKFVKKWSKSCQKVVKKLSKSCQNSCKKVVKKLLKSCQKVVKVVAPGKKTKIRKRVGEEEGEGKGDL